MFDAQISKRLACSILMLSVLSCGVPRYGDLRGDGQEGESSSKKILHAGPLGSGARLKLCVNTNTYFLYQAVYESARLAQAAGVDLDLLREVGDSNGQLSRMALVFFDMFRQRGDPELWPPFEEMLRGSTAIARKDLACAMAMARESGVDDSALARVRERMGEIYGVEPARKR